MNMSSRLKKRICLQKKGPQKKGRKFKQPLKKKAASCPQPWLVLLMVYATDGPPRTTGTAAAAAADAASLDTWGLPMICWLRKEDTPLILLNSLKLTKLKSPLWHALENNSRLFFR